uniref:Uncharacterized protein n=1 Tax=Klebsiella pneumoniae TaxID=573 RepID=A0A8B0SSX9_KLEPN|nr:hypothetical protein [Klebsiella pneumoniae]
MDYKHECYDSEKVTFWLMMSFCSTFWGGECRSFT